MACVLLIACANVANLQLARALVARERAGDSRRARCQPLALARQLLTESTLLALFGAAAGVILAIWSLDGIIALCPRETFRASKKRASIWSRLLFTGVVAIGAGILAGIWPAWKISRTAALSVVLHEAGTRGGSGGASQTTRALGPGDHASCARRRLARRRRFNPEKFLARAKRAARISIRTTCCSTTIDLPQARYEKDEKVNAFYDENRAFWDRFLERVRVLPGVESAAIGANIPFDDTEWDSYFHLTGTPPAKPGTEPSAEINMVSPDYFKVLRMPIIRGRAFGPEDVAGRIASRSVIIDQIFDAEIFSAGEIRSVCKSMTTSAAPRTTSRKVSAADH